MGLLTFLAVGVAAGAGLFAARRAFDARPDERARIVPGLIVAILIGLPLILITRHIVYGEGAAFTEVAPEGSAGLAALAFLVWGIALSRAYSRLYPAPAAAPVVSAPAPDSAVRRLNRRQFLIELGGASAAITVIGAGVGELLASREERDLEATIKARREAAEAITRRAAQCRWRPSSRARHPAGIHPARNHYRNRSTSNSRPVDIDGAEWRLRIHGRVDQAGRIDADDLGHAMRRANHL